MKLSPSEQKLYENLQPSKFSSEGFLGTDTRPVNEIIADDLQTIENLGITKERLVSVLKDIYEKAKNSLGAEIIIAPNTIVRFYESMGRIPSPFKGDGVFEKGEAVVTDKNSGKTSIITALSINLIEKHDFFQGKGSRYRVDPAEIVQILNITAE